MLNEETRELRKNRIGGSDIGVILGLSTFKTREQLLREKVTGEQEEFIGNKYIDFGNEAEPLIFTEIKDKLREKYGVGSFLIESDVCEYTDKYIANLDGLITTKDITIQGFGISENSKQVIEIKTTTEKNAEKVIEKIFKKKHAYYFQALHYMHITQSPNASFVIYPVSEYEYENGVEFMDFSKMVIVRIVYDTEQAKKMYAACDKFIEEVEKAKIEGLPQDVITLDDKTDELVEKFSGVMSVYADVESQLKELKKQKEAFENELEQHMRENGVKSFETNGYKFTIVKDSERRTLDKKLVEKLLTKEQYESCEKITHVNGSLKVTKMKG